MHKNSFIYCRPELAASFNPTTSIIAGELAYWVSKKGKRWARRQDLADLLGVAEVTIKRQGKNLAEIFHIKRTMIRSGEKVMPGANEYTLKSQYCRLKWREGIQLGVTDPNSGVLPFALEFLGIAKDADDGRANVNLAWFLCSLSKVMHHHGAQSIKFVTWSSLENWTQTKPKTAKRYLAKAVDAGLLTVESPNGLTLKATNLGRRLMLSPFVHLDNHRELRAKKNAAARMDGMLEAMDRDNLYIDELESYMRLCEKELGTDLLAHYAKRNNLIDSYGNYEVAEAHWRLVGEGPRHTAEF